MKKVLILFAVLSAWAFGYNYSGTWVNSSETTYNDPIKLVIKGNRVTPTIKRSQGKASLKSKNTTNVGSGLFDVWGHGSKNLALFIKPINSNKIRVIAKKIDLNRKKVVTKNFTFTKKGASSTNIRKRYVGNYRGGDSFSALNKLTIREVDGRLYVRAWKRTRNGLKALGVARAKLYNNRLHISWNRGNLVVNATIKGYNYNRSSNRYNNLELYIKASNLNNGLTNSQTLYLKRGNIRVPRRPVYKQNRIIPIY